jgi:chemotaxis protein methyltransferase CheR
MIRKEKIKTPPEVLRQFSDFLAGHLGIQFKEDSLWNLEQKLYPMAVAMGEEDLEKCLKKIISVPPTEEIKAKIAHYITIGETSFFRDQRLCKALEEKIIPDLIRERWNERKLKIWSAACCSGDEIYSIAIILHRLIPNIHDWDLTLIGTDINRDFLKKAEKAVYSKWSLRSTSQLIKDKYFIPRGHLEFCLVDEIKKLVKFYPLNLVEEIPLTLIDALENCDIILSCNVLYYFSTKQAEQVVERFQRILNPTGLLVVSPVEIPLINHERLEIEEIKKKSRISYGICSALSRKKHTKFPH